jgi:hypothetical protein
MIGKGSGQKGFVFALCLPCRFVSIARRSFRNEPTGGSATRSPLVGFIRHSGMEITHAGLVSEAQ